VTFAIPARGEPVGAVAPPAPAPTSSEAVRA